jgi:hypothetical protein
VLIIVGSGTPVTIARLNAEIVPLFGYGDPNWESFISGRRNTLRFCQR